MFLLLRRSCAIYRDFAQYCLAQNIADPSQTQEGTPTATSTKLLPSPELEPLKMLSPFAPIRKMSPLLKSAATEARSVLRNISARRKDQLRAAVAPVCGKITIGGRSSRDDREDKKDLPNVPRATKPMRVPFLDRTGAADLITSPLINTEGVRLVVKEDEEKKEPSMVVCACGSECKDPLEEQHHICRICLNTLKAPRTSGYLYEKINKRTLNRFWYTLVGNHLYSIASGTTM